MPENVVIYTSIWSKLLRGWEGGAGQNLKIKKKCIAKHVAMN